MHRHLRQSVSHSFDSVYLRKSQEETHSVSVPWGVPYEEGRAALLGPSVLPTAQRKLALPT